jgi:hypothetical protein
MEYYSFVDFANILNADNTVKDTNSLIYNIKELYDGYTKHLMVCKCDLDDIKRKRMQSVISNYIDFYGDNKNYDRMMLENEYKNHIIDTFNKTLDPPKSFFTRARRDYLNYEKEEQTERENCDINNHYMNINKKYEYYHNLQSNKEIKDDDNDELYLYEDIVDDDYMSHSYDSEEYYDYDDITEDESDYYSDEMY